jgi:hypothetical protein
MDADGQSDEEREDPRANRIVNGWPQYGRTIVHLWNCLVFALRLFLAAMIILMWWAGAWQMACLLAGLLAFSLFWSFFIAYARHKPQVQAGDRRQPPRP